MIKEHTYFVRGMHCSSCEILIEKKLLEISRIKSVEASTSKGRVVIEYEGDKPNVEILNNVFKKDNYLFFNNEYEFKVNDKNNIHNKSLNKNLIAFGLALSIVIVFIVLDRMGISNFVSVTESSSLLAFLGFGLLAGVSSCAALVGGIVLSMSKQWNEIYKKEETTFNKIQPHLLFNTGRVLSYIFFGGLLGLLGSRLQLSIGVVSFLIIAISLFMVMVGLQMLGVRALQKFQISTPKFITRKISDEKSFNGKYAPFVMGAATFFLPCGFTVIVQSVALLSGSVISGAMIMGYFALGTLPVLLLIGFSSVKLLERPHLAQTFSRVAGFLLLFFALFNINNQMNVLGLKSLNDIFPSSGQLQIKSDKEDNLAPIISGSQVIKTKAFARRYSPNYFKVKLGIPVKWEVTSSGEPGCTNSGIISNGLFDGKIDIIPGKATVKEFTPQKTGKYKFTCTMGMYTGIIEVVN